MAFTREQIAAEMQRRGLSVPAAPPQFSRDQIAAEMHRRGLQIPTAAPTPAAELAAPPVPVPAGQPADVPPMDPAALAAWQAQGRPEPAPEPTFGEQVIGGAETALTALTGATGGAAGMISGTALGVLEAVKRGELGSAEGADLIEQMAMRGAGRLTYEPRTAAGQEMAGQLGELTQALPPVIAGVPVGVTTGMGAQARAAIPKKVPRFAIKPLRGETSEAPEIRPGGSIGAAEVGQPEVRQLLAEELPVPIKLTKGQRERGFEQQQFEREAAKGPEGEALRERFAQQNVQLQQNLDNFIDATETEAFELRDIGASVDKALKARAKRDKDKIRVLYDEAEKAGELKAPVELPQLVKHLNESAPEAEVANVLKAIRAKAVKVGAAQESPDGTLVPGSLSLKNAETLRKSINASTNQEAPNIRQAAIMKGLIDDDTAEAGGNVYGKARAERRRFAENYEDIGAVKRLMGTKPGTTDRIVALEDVLNESVFKSPLDSVKQVRRVLQTEGEAGQQAWKDLQGGVLMHIRNQITDNMQIDQAGNRVVSPAKLNKLITKLDGSGKLDFIFTKKGAEQLRTINEVAQDLLTSPPGSVNHSNTASALGRAMETVASYITLGLPIPIVTTLRAAAKMAKDRKTKRRIKEALK